MSFKGKSTGELQAMQASIENVLGWLTMQSQNLKKMSDEINSELLTKNQSDEKESVQHNKGKRTAIEHV